MYEGDVVVGPDSECTQVLLHESRLWHIRHLDRKTGTDALEPEQTFSVFTCPHSMKNYVQQISLF